MRDGAPELLSSLLGALDPELRAAAVFALGCLIHSHPRAAPGAAPAPDARYPQPGTSAQSSSAASLGLGGAGGSGATIGGAAAAGGGLPPSGSAASLSGAAMDGGAAPPSSAATGALLEAAISSEQSIAALLLRANVSGLWLTGRAL
jgi:hypothetical protein